MRLRSFPVNDRDPQRDALTRRVGTNLRAARLRKNLSQAALALKLHEDQTTIARWDRGEQMPRPQSLMALARVLDCNVADLFVPLDDENGDPEPERVVA